MGRSETADVRLPAKEVSLVHGKLMGDERLLVYVDLGSTNGSLVDGRPAMRDERVRVGVGSRIVVGPFELRLVPVDTAEEVSTTRDTASIARQMVRDALALMVSQPLPAVEVLTGSSAGRRYVLEPGSVTAVGRGDGCVLQLDDADASRRHAEIVAESDSVRLIDVGSKNGVSVNGQRIEESAALRHGDEIRIGATSLRFTDPAEETLQALESEGRELGLQSAAAVPGRQVAQSQAVGPPSECACSGELRYAEHAQRELSPASAFELGGAPSVVQQAQIDLSPEPTSVTGGRLLDLVVLLLGVLLVVGGTALIVYLVSY